MIKRVASGALVVVGVVFVVVAFARNLFAVGTDFEEMIDDFRPIITDESIASYRADLNGLTAVAVEFETSLAPALAGQLGFTPEEFSGFVATQFPDVATGLATLPEAGPQFLGLIDLLADQQSNFESADAIPTKDFPAMTVPWGIFLLGLVAIVLGALMFRMETRVTAIVALVLGALIVFASFLLTLPGKSADADDLNAALKPVYTVETVDGAQQGLFVIGAMGQQMQTEMLPALGAQLGMDEATLMGFLGENFPATANALGTMPDSLGRFGDLVEVFQANLDNYDTLRPVAFLPIIWIFILGGFVMAIAGAVRLFGDKPEMGVEVEPVLHKEPELVS